MKTIAVMSGKGGTGKTMVAAGFAVFSDERLLLADCDVDAANLSLLLKTANTACRPFMGLECASIDPDAVCWMRTVCSILPVLCNRSGRRRNIPCQSPEMRGVRRVHPGM